MSERLDGLDWSKRAVENAVIYRTAANHYSDLAGDGNNVKQRVNNINVSVLFSINLGFNWSPSVCRLNYCVFLFFWQYAWVYSRSPNEPHSSIVAWVINFIYLEYLDLLKFSIFARAIFSDWWKSSTRIEKYNLFVRVLKVLNRLDCWLAVTIAGLQTNLHILRGLWTQFEDNDSRKLPWKYYLLRCCSFWEMSKTMAWN